MILWLWGIILFLIISFLLLYIRAEITIVIREDESCQGFEVHIHSLFYKMSRYYNYTDPQLRLLESILMTAIEKRPNDHQTPTVSADKIEAFIQSLKGFPLRNIGRLTIENRDIFAIVLRYIIVDELKWISTVGSQDALYTALNTGLCWALKGSIIGVLSSQCKLGKIMLDVKPDFSTPHFLSNFRCILKMRTVHIIIVEAYASVIKVRWCINGFAAGTTQSSH